MKKTLKSLFTPFSARRIFLFTLCYTLLGAVTAQSNPTWHWLYVFIANLVAVSFAYVFNQVSDAPLDALSESSLSAKNPIASGELPLPIGRWITWLLAVLALVLYASLGWKTFLLGLLTLVLGVLYSWNGLRLKGFSLLDLSNHGWLLATPLFLTSYLSLKPFAARELSFLVPFILFMSLFGQFTQESRNITKLQLAHPRHSVLIRERRLVHLLIILFLASGLICGAIALIIQQVIPLRVTILWFLLSAILFCLLYCALGIILA